MLAYRIHSAGDRGGDAILGQFGLRQGVCRNSPGCHGLSEVRVTVASQELNGIRRHACVVERRSRY